MEYNKNTHRSDDPSQQTHQEEGIKSITRQKVGEPARDRSIDVLRGLNCLAMILVNTAGPSRPHWLTHPVSIHQSITFADTLFPCFAFTSGLASARSRKIDGHNKSSSVKLKGMAKRAIKLILIGIAHNNLIPRLLGSHSTGLMDFKSYRIPSVLGRLGVASFVCLLESYLDLKPPIFPALLGLSWYLISCLRPFEPLHLTSQAYVDQKLFGRSHLHEPAQGFDPEGALSSLLTVPISFLLGNYQGRFGALSVTEPLQLAASAILGMLLTGLIPSPACKVLWTPTYVGQTTATSLLYWSLARALTLHENRVTGLLSGLLESLGQRSLEIYLLSTCCSVGLNTIGIWDSLSSLLDHILSLIGFKADYHRQVLVGLARSSLLGISMVPVAKILLRFNWKL